MNQARRFIGSIVFLYMLLTCSHAGAQAQNAISGIVVDSLTLRALPSVNVQIKGEMRGTVTDEKGNFSIMAASRDTLVFTLVGYTSVELPLDGYEPGIIRMSEKYTLLEAVTIDEYRGGELYEGMFEERNAQLRKRIPFYFSKARKEKIKVQSLREENIRVKTYVDIVINDPALKNRLMATYALSEDEYYDMLTAFNEKHYRVMYYLTPAELISLINSFFEAGNP